MAISLTFDRARAAHVLEALQTGKPLAPSNPAGWSRDDMLALAGALHFGAFTSGPTMHPGVQYEALTKERREAITEVFYEELVAAIEFYSNLHMRVADGVYSEEYQDRLHGILESKGDRKVSITITEGGKDEEASPDDAAA